MQSKKFCVLLVMLCMCLPAFGSETVPEENPPGPFSGAFADSVWTVIAFVVLLLALWKLVWKPMLAGLNARQEHIEKQISDAEETKKNAAKVLTDYNAKLDDVEHEGKKIIAEYVKKAENQGKEVIAKAGSEIEAMKLKAETGLERQQSEAQAQLWIQAGEIILKLGQDVLGKTIDEADNQKLIDQAVERLSQEEIKNKDPSG